MLIYFRFILAFRVYFAGDVNQKRSFTTIDCPATPADRNEPSTQRTNWRYHSISGAQIVAQTPYFDKKKKVTQKVSLAISGQTLASHNSAADWSRKLFKPSKDSWSFVVYNLKKVFKLWVWGFWSIMSWLEYVLWLFWKRYQQWHSQPKNLGGQNVWF